MGINYGTNIATDGMILYIDAANVKSYPGTGSTVTDISGNGLDGIMYGGTSYSSSNSGVFTFDGVDSTIKFGDGNDIFNIPEFTFELWFKSLGTVPTTGTSPAVFGFTYGMRSFIGSSNVSFGLDNGVDAFNYLYTTGIHNYRDSTYYHAVYMNDGSTSYIYINGEYNNSGPIDWLGYTRWPTNAIYIGRDNNNSMYYFYGEIPLFRIYNRLLSSSEIKQNFNATRGRYNI